MAQSATQTYGDSVASAFGIPSSVFQQQISGTQFGNLSDSQMISALTDIATNDSSYLSSNPGDYSGMLGSYGASTGVFGQAGSGTSSANSPTGATSSSGSSAIDSIAGNIGNLSSVLGGGSSGSSGISDIWSSITSNLWNIMAVVVGLVLIAYGLRGISGNN